MWSTTCPIDDRLPLDHTIIVYIGVYSSTTSIEYVPIVVSHVKNKIKELRVQNLDGNLKLS